MSEHPNKIRKHGSKICCDALLAFLKAKNASAHVVDSFEEISLSRQIALSDGIIFSGREILRRNEFVSGDFIVIGARRDYAFYVTNLRTGGVGLIPSHEVGNVSLKLEGTLEIKTDCTWTFAGTLKCFDDLYDFNASTHRSAIGEWLTSIGRETKGKPFYVEIRGEKAITESGTLEAKSSKWRIY